MKNQKYAKPELWKNGNIKNITFWNSDLSFSTVCNGDRSGGSYDDDSSGSHRRRRH